MLILDAVLAVILALPGTPAKPPSPASRPAVIPLAGPELARAVKAELESVAGAGTVEVSTESEFRFSVRITIQRFNSQICKQIYDREMGLHQLFPDVNFNFYYSTPELTRAIKTDLESISGPDTVDISIDSKSLLNVSVAIPRLNPQIYSEIFARELEFYRAFPDLNFDFYIRPAGVETASIF
jgi:copper chaperone CopZ